jgi:hypothetical protein
MVNVDNFRERKKAWYFDTVKYIAMAEPINIAELPLQQLQAVRQQMEEVASIWILTQGFFEIGGLTKLMDKRYIVRKSNI